MSYGASPKQVISANRQPRVANGRQDLASRQLRYGTEGRPGRSQVGIEL
ncbi:MAG: hypothetical protein ACR2HZ_03600 [Gemmatimonadaceae bacterium]